MQVLVTVLCANPIRILRWLTMYCILAQLPQLLRLIATCMRTWLLLLRVLHLQDALPLGYQLCTADATCRATAGVQPRRRPSTGKQLKHCHALCMTCT